MTLGTLSMRALAIILGVLCAILAAVVLLCRATDDKLSSVGKRVCLFAMSNRN